MTVSEQHHNQYSDQPLSSQQMPSLPYYSFAHHSKYIYPRDHVVNDNCLVTCRQSNTTITFRYLTGKFYYYVVAYIPCFLASSMAVMIEKPSRRSSLAFYVANVASETLFRIYVARGWLKPVKNGQVYIFTLAIATIMFLAKKHGFEDDPLSAAIKLIVGTEEASKRQRKRHTTETDNQQVRSDNQVDFLPLTSEQAVEMTSDESHGPPNNPTPAVPGLFGNIKNTLNWFKFFLTTRHRLCPHHNCSCVYYASKASLRALSIGCAAQLGLRLLTKAPAIIGNPRILKSIVLDTSLFRVGLFLSTFSGLYKAANCWLRWSLDTSKPINCFIAGLVAGPSLFIYPSPTVALYVLWKCLEALFHEAVRNNLIRCKDLFIVILYGLATSQLFYSALMDPRYMKKSYMAFLHRMSHHKLHMVNRSVLDVFGTQASSGYEEFFPDLHPKFMSRAFLGSIWIWMIEQKFVAKNFDNI